MFEKKTPNDSNSPLKEKEKEGGEKRSQLGGQWKVLMFSGQWKVLMLSGLWKVPMFGGQWKEKKKYCFTSSHFPSNKFYLNFYFFLWT